MAKHPKPLSNKQRLQFAVVFGKTHARLDFIAMLEPRFDDRTLFELEVEMAEQKAYIKRYANLTKGNP
jgi:hypothetical protein